MNIDQNSIQSQKFSGETQQLVLYSAFHEVCTGF